MNIFKKIRSSVSSKTNSQSIVMNGSKTYINGKLVDGDSEEKEFFLEKEFDSFKVERLFVDVVSMHIMLTCEKHLEKVKVTIHGKASNEPKFDIDIVDNNTLSIKSTKNDNYFINNGSIQIANITINNGSISSSSSNLTMCIHLPEKVLKSVDINDKSGEISFINTISSEVFNINTISGAIKGYLLGDRIFCKTISGLIDLGIYTNNRLELKTNTVSGDTYLRLNNMNICKTNFNSVSGSISNDHLSEGQFDAYITASSVSGSIRIR